MKELADLLAGALSGGNLAALPLAFVGGVVTGLNPCCIPLYPAAAATCCAACGDRSRIAWRTAAAFVAGAALATAALGVAAALVGRTLVGVGGWPRYLIALVPLAMGVHLFGWVRIPLPRLRRAGEWRNGCAFLTGFLLSLVVAPCGTPVLAAVLSYAAYTGSAPYGGVLLFLFGLGAGVPMVLIGSTAARLAGLLDAGGWRSWVDRATALVLLGSGFYLLWMA